MSPRTRSATGTAGGDDGETLRCFAMRTGYAIPSELPEPEIGDVEGRNHKQE
jgi:hypothetical protein